ncbi:MAG: ankyrin repeat domain-containing protein [Verrucomicrobiia bacterium]
MKNWLKILMLTLVAGAAVLFLTLLMWKRATMRTTDTSHLTVPQMDLETANSDAVRVFDYARHGDVAKVRGILEKTPDLVNHKEKTTWSLLHCAVYGDNKDKEGCKAVIELLLAKGADINIKDARNETPLHVAVTHSSREVVELLLVHKADANAKDDCGHTPLHNAARKGNNDVVELLLACRADINAKSGFLPSEPHTPHIEDDPNYDPGLTSLNIAMKFEHPDTAALLRSHGGKSGKELGDAGAAKAK